MGTTGTAPDNELEQRYIRYKDVIKELTIMNDIFMRNVLKKRECAEYILRIIMEMKNLQVVDNIVQKDYKNLQGRSAILDCVARDNKDKRYNVEIQQESEGASPKRARYHSGLLDMNTLNPGQDYEELPESYVIFITRDDVQGKGLPVYHADRVIEETGETFGDGSHIIYVNSSIQDEDTALGRDFCGKKSCKLCSVCFILSTAGGRPDREGGESPRTAEGKKYKEPGRSAEGFLADAPGILQKSCRGRLSGCVC